MEKLGCLPSSHREQMVASVRIWHGSPKSWAGPEELCGFPKCMSKRTFFYWRMSAS